MRIALLPDEYLPSGTRVHSKMFHELALHLKSNGHHPIIITPGTPFQDSKLIIDNFDYSCLNISGSKKLNGSQLLRENISYILNSLKQSIVEHEKNKTILHIFNSKSVLDGVNIKNLPISSFGDFYNHE